MKKIALFIFCFGMQYIWAQENLKSVILKVTYDHYFKVFESDRELRRDTMQLLIDGTRTSFMENKQYVLDSTYSMNGSVLPSTAMDANYMIGMQQYKNSYRIYTNNATATYRKAIGNNVIYEYDEELELQWQLESGSKTILGYFCKKAMLDYGGRTWTAWYAPELPYNAGPYKFKSLPGLILEMVDSSSGFQFNAIALQQIDSSRRLPVTSIMSNQVILDISHDEFLKQQDAFDQLSILEQFGFGSEVKITIQSVEGENLTNDRKYTKLPEEKRVYIEKLKKD